MNIVTILHNAFQTIIARRDGRKIVYKLRDYKLNGRHDNVNMTIIVEKIECDNIYWRYLKNPYDKNSLSKLYTNTLFGMTTAITEQIDFLSFDRQYIPLMINEQYDIEQDNKKPDELKMINDRYAKYLDMRHNQLKREYFMYQQNVNVVSAQAISSAGAGGGRKTTLSVRRGISYDIIGLTNKVGL